METLKSKTVFVEYSSHKPGQHFMTVMQTKDHKRIIIGRIYRAYDSETKKTKYIATDVVGNQIFGDINDLSELKKNYIENGERLAGLAPVMLNKGKLNEQRPYPQEDERYDEMKTIREKKSAKVKVQEISKPITITKTDSKLKDRVLDSEKRQINTSKEQIREGNNPGNQVSEKTDLESEKHIPSEQKDNSQTIEKSEREMELEQIREHDNDKEQEIDR